MVLNPIKTEKKIFVEKEIIIKKSFKICNSNLEKPLKSLNFENLDDSAKKLNDF